MSKHSEGPWRWELNEKSRRVELCGGKPRYDLIVMDFVRYGFSGAAPRFNVELRTHLNVMKRGEEFGEVVPGREHHADWFKRLKHPDAQLIEAAPAFALAWGAVPDDVKDRVLASLPEWAREAIKAVEDPSR